jgi:flagellar motility protein MotE (MotC chaperone)
MNPQETRMNEAPTIRDLRTGGLRLGRAVVGLSPRVILACALLALLVQVSQLVRTDWHELAVNVRDALVAPVTAAGEATPPSSPAPSQPERTPDPQGALPAPLYASEGSVALAVEAEMARLLDELKSQEAAPHAPPQPQSGAALAEAALARRIEEATSRLEALRSGIEQQAPGGELAKPKAIFENMKPAEAALILASMEEATAAEIMAAMDERKAAAVLASMPSDHAGRVALAIKALGLGIALPAKR